MTMLRGNIRSRYDFISFGTPAYHRLIEFGCRVLGGSYRYHVYAILRVDHIKFQMTWNHFFGFFFTLWSNAAILQGKTTQKP